MEQIVTKTMAEIYLRQGHLQEAYDIFKILSERDPSDLEIKMRLKELRDQLNPSPPLIDQSSHPVSAKINVLIRWLDNIKKWKRI